MISQLRSRPKLWLSALILPALAAVAWTVMLPGRPVEASAPFSIDALHRGAPLDLPSTSFDAN